MEEKNYQKILEEALNDVNQLDHANTIYRGNGKASIALGLVVGDLKETIKQVGKKIDTLNSQIDKFSKSSDKYALGMIVLTLGLIIVGFLQVFVNYYSF